MGKALWPNLVLCPKERQRLKLAKAFLTVKDLKFELERRDLERVGNKSKLKARLERYLSSKECKKNNHILVHGYCRKRERKYGLVMPIYLMQIVNAYFPPCI